VQDSGIGVVDKSEDLYAMGNFYVGDIYGQIPFADVDNDMIEEVIKLGGRPDITLGRRCYDCQLIVSYLDCGNRLLTRAHRHRLG